MLTLLADDVLILSSHLLDADMGQLHTITNGLSDFIVDGKVKTVLYKGYSTLEEYLYHKTESTSDQALHLSYQRKADYIKANIFDSNSHFLSVNNEQEREQFHSIYVDTNLSRASQTSYHSTHAYDPASLMNVLISLDTICDANDIKALSSQDIDKIRRHRGWRDFQVLFSILHEDTFIFNEFIKREKDVQRKIEFIKEFLFSAPLGLFSDILLSPVIIGFPPGIVTLIISKMLDYLVSNSQSVRLMRQVTINRIIERLIVSKEPLYVVTSRLKRVVEKIMRG